MVMLSSLAMDYSLLPATFQDLRFGVMFISSSQRGVQFKPWLFHPQQCPIFEFFCLTI
jgi:hypothetical protein